VEEEETKTGREEEDRKGREFPMLLMD